MVPTDCFIFNENCRNLPFLMCIKILAQKSGRVKIAYSFSNYAAFIAKEREGAKNKCFLRLSPESGRRGPSLKQLLICMFHSFSFWVTTV